MVVVLRIPSSRLSLWAAGEKAVTFTLPPQTVKFKAPKALTNSLTRGSVSLRTLSRRDDRNAQLDPKLKGGVIIATL
jgi:hypothetical protein